MKNYLYKTKINTGFFETFCYNQVRAANEKAAILEIVVTLRQRYDEDTEHFLNENLGLDWTVHDFWETMDTRFATNNDSVIQELIWVKEIQFDLETI
ncbi:MAG: hypothetical protein RLZZ628_3746 [Bacteroidota bacterium]|jgi:hypothetical protein